jgi:hypothetical protein
MDVKYQIFVSSTYEDLKEERNKVIMAILEMGHIPVGMELFSAADVKMWNLIERQIDQSDYYIVIIAHRYGTTEENISYTEKEYDYAYKQNVPILGFVLDDNAKWAQEKKDKDISTVFLLGLFKAKVRRKYCSTWQNADDLYGKVSIALNKQIQSTPRSGWVRRSDITANDRKDKRTQHLLSRLDSVEKVTIDDKGPDNGSFLTNRQVEEYQALLHKAMEASSDAELQQLAMHASPLSTVPDVQFAGLLEKEWLLNEIRRLREILEPYA